MTTTQTAHPGTSTTRKGESSVNPTVAKTAEQQPIVAPAAADAPIISLATMDREIETAAEKLSQMRALREQQAQAAETAKKEQMTTRALSLGALFETSNHEDTLYRIAELMGVHIVIPHQSIGNSGKRAPRAFGFAGKRSTRGRRVKEKGNSSSNMPDHGKRLTASVGHRVGVAANAANANISEVARRFGVSRQTVYGWQAKEKVKRKVTAK